MQIQNYASSPAHPAVSKVEGSDTFYLSPKDLRTFINSAEWNLASAVSTDPTINLLLYIPSKLQSPLHVLHSNGERLQSNAFIIPRWGGVVINNPTFDATKSKHFESVELHGIMEIYIDQLRSLLGVKTQRLKHHTSNIVKLLLNS